MIFTPLTTTFKDIHKAFSSLLYSVSLEGNFQNISLIIKKKRHSKLAPNNVFFYRTMLMKIKSYMMFSRLEKMSEI